MITLQPQALSSRFDIALETLTEQEQESVRGWMADHTDFDDEGRQMQLNICAEEHLFLDSFVRVLKEVASRHKAAGDWLAAFEEICPHHRLEGDETLGAKPEILNRAIREDDLPISLRIPASQAENGSRFVVRHGPLSPEAAQWWLAPGAERGFVWATWNLGAAFKPWYNNLSADDVRELLGLSTVRAKTRLVMITYRRPLGELRFPTIADAGRNVRFRPAPKEYPCGVTCHLVTREPSMPEAVHKNARLGGLLVDGTTLGMVQGRSSAAN